MAIDFGIFLPSPDEGISVAAAARHAEAVGLDTLWSGDHLVVDWGFLDAPLALATAAAATEHLTIGLGVYLPALRPPVWAAKHVATLQYLTGGERLELGIGLGGKVGDGPDEWAAAGVSFTGRAERTDRFLANLPALLGGNGSSGAPQPR